MTEEKITRTKGDRRWIISKGRMNPDARLRDITAPEPETKVPIVFYDSPKRKADFRVKLKYDSLKQSEFLRAMISGYLEDDPDLMAYVERYKESMEIHSRAKRSKSKLLRKRARKEKINFALSEDDVDNIFDIIAEENPDL